MAKITCIEGNTSQAGFTLRSCLNGENNMFVLKVKCHKNGLTLSQGMPKKVREKNVWIESEAYNTRGLV